MVAVAVVVVMLDEVITKKTIVVALYMVASYL